MSFGWSAGDITVAIKLVHGIYKVLDSCDGAASEYREAVAFLKELTQTLEPLKTFAAWNAYPAHWRGPLIAAASAPPCARHQIPWPLVFGIASIP